MSTPELIAIAGGLFGAGGIATILKTWMDGKRISGDASFQRMASALDDLGLELVAVRARTLTLETQYSTLWTEHTTLQREHVGVLTQLSIARAEVARLTTRVSELETAADAMNKR